MLEFLKRCGLGVLYLIAAPFAVVLLALFAVVGLIVFIFMLFKSFILFFSGRSVFDDLPEDIEAKRRLGTLVDTRAKKTETVDKTVSDETHEETHEIERAAPQEVPEDDSDDADSGDGSSADSGGEAK